MALTPAQARQVLDSAELVCPAAVISSTVERMAREISAAVADRFPLVLCVMRGAMIFGGQLLPQLRFPLELDYLDLSRYGDATRGGHISWRVTPGAAVSGRVVLVLDDILDEGHTLAAIIDKLRAAGASRVYTAVIAEKDIGRARRVKADFVGVRLPDRYVFGYGMDVSGAWRNLPEIYALKKGHE